MKLLKTVLCVLLMLTLFSTYCFADDTMTEEEIKAIWDKAEAVASVWYCDGFYDFDGDGNIYGSDETELTVPGTDMTDYYINTHMTKDEMHAFMLSLFSEETVKTIMAFKGTFETGRFIEHDGIMYYQECRYPLFTGVYPKREFRVTEYNGSRIVYSMRQQKREYAETPDMSDRATVTFDYVLEKNESGSWIFTSYVYSYALFVGVENPQTSDSAVYITAAAGLIALCCAVICKKKIKT